MSNPLKEWSRIRGGKMILAGVLIGLLLLLFGGGMQDKSASRSEPEGQENLSVQFYTEQLEKRIEDLCRRMRGISEVHVLLTLDGSSEYVYAEDGGNTSREYVLMQRDSAEEPLLVQEICPRIRGVAVVCTHGDDSAVRLAITELLCAALGIPASAVRVAGT